MPTHGYTPNGQPVHARTTDHHPTDTAYQRFNKKLAVTITKNVGTMTSAYLFCALSLLSLPAVLDATGWIGHPFPGWLVKASLIGLVAWFAQTFLQLVLLPIIIVGQNVQAEASDARAAKTFADVETIVDRLDIHTQGGIAELRDALVQELKADR